MYLDENLIRLNKKYNPIGLEFKIEGDVINVIERPEYLLNNNPELKAYLNRKVKMIFQKPILWHIGHEGIQKLKSQKLKMEPFNTVNNLKEEFYQLLDLIEEDSLKDSMMDYFNRNEFFFDAPASLGYHHGYRGGLLEHIVQVLKLSLTVVDNMEEDILIDKDLIIAGSILHDIGKINCYQIDNDVISRTQTYDEQNHVVNGIKLVSQHIESEKLDKIIHIIASHHNLPEWGSPIPPRSNEAWIIHFIENLSSKLMG